MEALAIRGAPYKDDVNNIELFASFNQVISLHSLFFI
jgi:hypothetical protein